MYTEVKELANLIARLLFTKVPRNKVCIFAEHYANQLLLRFAANWDASVTEEKINVVTLRDGDMFDRDLQCSADAVLVRKDTLIKQIPDGFSVRIGPGYVGYRVKEGSPLIHIWNGPINADDKYNPFPEFVLHWKSSNPGMFTPTNMGIGKGVRGGVIYGRGNTDDGSKLDIHDFVALRLIVRPLSTHGHINQCFSESLHKKSFEYTGKEDANVEVGHFAATRFGSQKKRPDYELMQRILRQVAPESSIGHEGIPPPPQAFADKPSPAPIQFPPFNNEIKDNMALCYSVQPQNMFGPAGDIKIIQDESSNTMAFLQGINKSGGLNDAINGAQIKQNMYGAPILYPPSVKYLVSPKYPPPVKKFEFQ